jgi:hypothetical protein
MRYTPALQMNHARGWAAGNGRPAFDLLPPELVTMLIEYDRLGNQAQAARVELQQLSDPKNDAAAKLEDDAKAVAAARAGKQLPPAKAVVALAEARKVAARAVEVQEAAHTACGHDLTNWAANDAGDVFAAVASDIKSRRVEVEQLADQLSTAVEDAVRAGAVGDWLNGLPYFTQATTWPTEVIADLANCGVARSDTRPVSVRSVITTAALTVLETGE